MFIRNWYHGLLERLPPVTHIQTNHTIVCPLSKDVATNQQESIVISEVFIKLSCSFAVGIVGEIEVVGDVNISRSGSRVIFVVDCEIHSPIISVPVSITPVYTVIMRVSLPLHKLGRCILTMAKTSKIWAHTQTFHSLYEGFKIYLCTGRCTRIPLVKVHIVCNFSCCPAIIFYLIEL